MSLSHLMFSNPAISIGLKFSHLDRVVNGSAKRHLANSNVIRGLAYLWRIVARPLYWVLGWLPHTPRIWVFGAWFGERFSDNSKYLFLHVARSRPGVQAVWLAGKLAVVREVRAHGGKAYLRLDPRAWWYQLRAGITVITVGLRDVLETATRGSLVIQLWHGTPLKRIGRDDERFERSPRGLSRLAWGFRNRLIRAEWQRYRLFPAASEECREVFMRAFEQSGDRVPVLGYPRNDILVRSQQAPELRQRLRTELLAACGLAVPEDTRLIAYLPTHRQEGRGRQRLLPFEDLEQAGLDAGLKEVPALVLYKGHFYHSHETTEQSRSGMQAVADVSARVPDVQVLLAVADVLVTDLSSCFFDFLLCDRPMVFLEGAIDEYVREERGLYFPYREVTPGYHVRTQAEFLAAIADAIARPDLHGSDRARVRNRFYPLGAGDASERVAAAIDQLVKSRWPRWS